MKKKLIVSVVILGGLLAGAGSLFLAIQFVPTGLSTTNPPVAAEPAWDSAQTRALAERACFDCHSNETRWPPYARIAPMSWLVAHDVAEGRQALNFSEWDRARSDREEDEARGGDKAGEQLEEVMEAIQEGDMPPASYVVLHPAARLTPAEQQQLIDGFRQSLQ